jgi:sigma-B regulation protein RsbU (phosphoserine phosphatase)
MPFPFCSQLFVTLPSKDGELTPSFCRPKFNARQKKKQISLFCSQLFVTLSPENLNDMQSSLSARLTYRIMAVVLAMMMVIAGVVYYTVREYMLNEAKERYKNMLLNSHEELRRHLSDVYVASKNNVHDIERDIDNPDRMFGHMERIVRQNPAIVCCAMLFKQDYYPSKGRVFVPCARKDTADNIIVSRIDSTYNSYFYGEWFQEQMKKNKGCWTKAYFESEFFADGQEPRLLTTYTVPIHDFEGHPVALLAADVSLEYLRNEMMEDVTKMNAQFKGNRKHQAYSFVLDHEGTYIIHPDKKRMLRDTLKADTIMPDEIGSATAGIDSVPSWIYYRKIKYVEWTMAVVVPDDVILFNGRMLNIIILAVMVIGMLAIYLFCRRQIKGIADPFAAKKAVMERELNIAHNIQMALLPKPFPEHADINLYAAQTPARDVGGDLYDYFVHEGRLVFCIGDVSGKGVPAALLMAVMRSMFRSEAHRADRAADIVETMNRNLGEEYQGGDFVTMFVGILDLSSGRLDYCNAGHEAPLVAGQPLDVKRNLPIGALSDWIYEGQQTQLKPGDMLFLYTDGLSEAKDTADRQFGRKHVIQLANDHNNDTAQQLVEFMEDEVKHHVGDAEQSDDITMLAIKWQPTSQLSMSASMDDISCIEPFTAHVAKQAGIEGKEAKRLRLAIEEAVANIINHGQATTIKLQAKTDDNQLVLTIDDDGQPFDPTADSATDFSVPADERPPGGLGIMFLHQMTDGLEYQRLDGHNVLKIIKGKKVNR